MWGLRESAGTLQTSEVRPDLFAPFVLVQDSATFQKATPLSHLSARKRGSAWCAAATPTLPHPFLLQLWVAPRTYPVLAKGQVCSVVRSTANSAPCFPERPPQLMLQEAQGCLSLIDSRPAQCTAGSGSTEWVGYVVLLLIFYLHAAETALCLSHLMAECSRELRGNKGTFQMPWKSGQAYSP